MILYSDYVLVPARLKSLHISKRQGLCLDPNSPPRGLKISQDCGLIPNIATLSDTSNLSQSNVWNHVPV